MESTLYLWYVRRSYVCFRIATLHFVRARLSLLGSLCVPYPKPSPWHRQMDPAAKATPHLATGHSGIQTSRPTTVLRGADVGPAADAGAASEVVLSWRLSEASEVVLSRWLSEAYTISPVMDAAA